MQNELLRQFNGDVHTKEALTAFIITVIEEEALNRMYKGEDVSHIKDAKELLDKAFEQLDIIYGIKEKPKLATNESK